MIFWHARSDKLLTLKILVIQFFKILSQSIARLKFIGPIVLSDSEPLSRCGHWGPRRPEAACETDAR